MPYKIEEAPALDAALSAELSELEEVADVSADELDMTTASRTAIGLRSCSMPAFPERQALELCSREASVEPPSQDAASDWALQNSQVGQALSLLLTTAPQSEAFRRAAPCMAMLVEDFTHLWLGSTLSRQARHLCSSPTCACA